MTLGCDLSGRIAALGPDVSHFAIGDEVFGVTNPRFTNAYARPRPQGKIVLAVGD